MTVFDTIQLQTPLFHAETRQIVETQRYFRMMLFARMDFACALMQTTELALALPIRMHRLKLQVVQLQISNLFFKTEYIKICLTSKYIVLLTDFSNMQLFIK